MFFPLVLVVDNTVCAHGNEEAYASFSYDENGIRTAERNTEEGLSWDFATEDGVITGRQSDDGKNDQFLYDDQWGAKSFKAFLDKKTASWVAQKFLGFIFSSSVKKFLTIAIDYLDIFLSPGGAMAGILDFAYDGKINNVLYRF